MDKLNTLQGVFYSLVSRINRECSLADSDPAFSLFTVAVERGLRLQKEDLRFISDFYIKNKSLSHLRGLAAFTQSYFWNVVQVLNLIQEGKRPSDSCSSFIYEAAGKAVINSKDDPNIALYITELGNITNLAKKVLRI